MDALILNLVHIPFGRIAPEIAMASHCFLATLRFFLDEIGFAWARKLIECVPC
jgi:hypothetical protein